MVFDSVKFDREHLMRDAIKYKEYENLKSILDDLGTLLNFQYCDNSFLEEIEHSQVDNSFEWPLFKSKDLDRLKLSIKEDFWGFICGDMNLKSFNMDKEYLSQNKLLHKKHSWQEDQPLIAVVTDNIFDCMDAYIDEWFANKVKDLNI